MPEETHNTDLRLYQIPTIDSDYFTISGFALTFDGNNRITDNALFANKIVDEFHNDHSIVVNLTLTKLRTCLFYEQRQYLPFGENPVGKNRDYINGLLLEISKSVKNHSTD